MTKSRRMRWAGHVTRMEKMRNPYKISVAEPEGTRPLGRPRSRWRTLLLLLLLLLLLILQTFEGVDWILLAQDKKQ
jgi:hypothetical protein